MKKCFVSILLSMTFVAGYATTTLAENIDKVDFSGVEQGQEILNEANDVTEETANFISDDLIETNLEINDEQTEENLERAIYNGWQKENGYYYYYENGKKAEGWRFIDGHYYYFSPYTGRMYNNEEAYIGGEYYRLSSNGTMVTGWYYDSINGKYKYYGSNGARYQYDWLFDGGYWYYFNNIGYMEVGQENIAGEYYRFDSNGKMITGWYYNSYTGNYEYYGDNGVRYNSKWLDDGYDWYYFDSSGNMVKGRKKIGTNNYKFNSNGTMITKWSYDSYYGTYEYYGSNGVRYESQWLSDGGKWYYLDYLGDMVTGEEYIGGKYYYFNSDGSQYVGWLYDRSCGHWLYYGANGQYINEWALIGGQWYHFNWAGCNV